MTTIAPKTLLAGLLVAALSSGLGCGWKLETRDSPANPEATTADATGTATATQGTLAPAFSLPNDDGSFVSLDDLLAEGRPAVLVFYRGHW
ncbi:redoxin domain-containing protein [Enhygromyxa salina]|uniref:redoxin domain-containing protein n=1 Tax=Enhygromyxa salina TaxID=215803 RepID=UPI0011BA8F43|nr:redoxin domain-containing protein [Enhygromyxa salina]